MKFANGFMLIAVSVMLVFGWFSWVAGPEAAFFYFGTILGLLVAIACFVAGTNLMTEAVDEWARRKGKS